MVLKHLLPPTGGSFRRFLAVRNHLYRDALHDDRPIRGPIKLFDFRHDDDVADLVSSLGPKKRALWNGWRVSDDGVIGGFSTSRMEFVSPDGSDGDDNDTNGDCVPFLRWSGTISTAINKSNPKSRYITRSGFAAILSPDYPLGVPLGNKYKALEICCRTDGRTYAVNLHVETYFPEDMYQGFIGRDGLVNANADRGPTDALQFELEGENNVSDIDSTTSNQQIETQQQTDEPNQSLDVREYLSHRYKRIYKLDPSNNPKTGFPPRGFTRLILPFRDFTLTSKGRARMEQRALDGAITLESIGFTLMDGQDGDFVFDLVSVRAVNILDGEVVGSVEDDAREEEIVRRFAEESGK